MKDSSDKKERFLQQLKLDLAGPTFTRLRQLVDKERNDHTKPTTTYEPGWEYKQAHYNGYLDALAFISKLIRET